MGLNLNNFAILVADGTDTAVNALWAILDNVAGIEEIKRWKCGDPKKYGGSYSTAGLRVAIPDQKSPHGLVIALRNLLAECEKRWLQFSGSDLSVKLSIGICVGDSAQYAACVGFEPDDLARLAKLRISLEVRAYPTSDQANEEL